MILLEENTATATKLLLELSWILSKLTNEGIRQDWLFRIKNSKEAWFFGPYIYQERAKSNENPFSSDDHLRH